MKKPAAINYLGISGGKDSVALLLWALNESGYPRESIVPAWVDTGNENDLTVKYVRWLSAKIRRIHTVLPPLDFYELARKKHSFPSARRRFCTERLKILPSMEYVRELIEGGFDVVIHTGVRAAESADRALLSVNDWDSLYDCETRRPLLKWTLAEIWAIHARYDVPPNPLYGMTERLPWNGEANPYYRDGVLRVGCWPCVMSRKEEIRKMAKHQPERIGFLRHHEETIPNPSGYASFFHVSKVPLAQRTGINHVAKSGKAMRLATIDDVARWSQTDRGGVQYMLDLPMTTELTDEAPSCASRYGYCE